MPLHASCRARRAGGDLRRDGRRAFAAAWLAASAIALGAASPAFADTQIYIAGPGARGNADAAQMTAAIASPPAAPSSLASASPSPEVATGMITIPGPGERAASAALPRENVVSAASGVAQVVVNSATNGAGAAQWAKAANAAKVANAAATLAARATPAPAAGPLATPVPPGQEDGETVRAAALAFLQQQSVGLPGHVAITVSPVFPRGLAACTSLEPFFPPGARTWGHTTVGVRCVGAKPWTLYVAARVAVDVTYYLAARPLDPGQTLNAMDLIAREGDLGNLPRTVVTDPSQAVGAVALMRISAGLPLRTDMLRSQSSVVIGQTVRLVAAGPNFTISADGQVLNNAAPGQQVRVRTAEGQIITGVVKDAGTVEVQI